MTENGANPPSKRLGSPFEYQPRSSFKNKTFAPTSGTSSSSDDDFVWSPAKMEEISDRLDEVHIESPLPRFDPFTYTAPGRNWSRAPGTALYPSKTPENLLSTEEKVLEMEREAKDKESRLQRARRERDHLRLAMTTDPVRRVFKAPTEANDIVLSPVPSGFTQGPLSGINNSVASFLNAFDSVPIPETNSLMAPFQTSFDHGPMSGGHYSMSSVRSPFEETFPKSIWSEYTSADAPKLTMKINDTTNDTQGRMVHPLPPRPLESPPPFAQLLPPGTVYTANHWLYWGCEPPSRLLWGPNGPPPELCGMPPVNTHQSENMHAHQPEHFGLYNPSPASSTANPFFGVTPPETPANPPNNWGYSNPTGFGLSPVAAEFKLSASEYKPMLREKPLLNAEPSRMTWGRTVKPGHSMPTSPGEDWAFAVQKIVLHSDQQSSINMQQKIKNAPTEEKFSMCEAIATEALALASNRFGNFLVQRCMEHGTPGQIMRVANSIRGHVIALSMDNFGCHVMQKALDTVAEATKTEFINEMLVDIRKTIKHRYACHVWQKLFELRWVGDPPQIMQTVNRQLRGHWADVAMGETGSLVVQNIFENCVEEDKRPCIDEILANIGTITRGQFGNWCIQHICENGSKIDRDRAINHILNYAATYSIDQYGSKVIEKCLKVGGVNFIDRYLHEIVEREEGRVRSPLIDIAGDQYGNYLIQWIITNSPPQMCDLVIQQVRQHMVSLRGSKYGARVAVMCNNPASGVRPGRESAIRGNFANGNGFFGRGGPSFTR